MSGEIDRKSHDREFLFILGAQKSGTTWLAEVLGRHSDIFIPSCKELHYFTRNYYKGEDWFDAQFARSRNERYLCEATPNYLAVNYPEYSEVPTKIKNKYPDAKFIVLLRDPIERAISAYMHHVVRGRFNYHHSIDDHFIELIESPVSIAGIIEFGLYLRQLKIYFSHFPKENFLILLFERELSGNPAEALSKIMAFLELKEEQLDLTIPKRNVGIKSAASARIGAALSHFMQDDQTRMTYGGLIQKTCVLLERFFRFDRLKLGQETVELLESFYREDSEGLSRLLGIDGPIWESRLDSLTKYAPGHQLVGVD